MQQLDNKTSSIITPYKWSTATNLASHMASKMSSIKHLGVMTLTV